MDKKLTKEELQDIQEVHKDNPDVLALLSHITALDGEVEEWKDTWERETKDLLSDCKELEDNYDNDLKKDRDRYKKMCRGLEKMIDECCTHEALLKEKDNAILELLNRLQEEDGEIERLNREQDHHYASLNKKDKTIENMREAVNICKKFDEIIYVECCDECTDKGEFCTTHTIT